MAKYNDFEKSVAEKLVGADGLPGGLVVLGNIWESFFPNIYYLEVKEQTRAVLQIRNSELPHDHLAMAQMDKNFRSTAYRMVTSIRRLEEEGLITLTSCHEASTLGEVWAGEEYVTFNFKDHHLYDELKELASRQIYVSAQLVELAKNGFVDDEVRHAQEEVVKYRRALIIAILGLCVAASGPLMSIYDRVFKEPATLKVEIVNPGPIQPSSGPANNVPGGPQVQKVEVQGHAHQIVDDRTEIVMPNAVEDSDPSDLRADEPMNGGAVDDDSLVEETLPIQVEPQLESDNSHQESTAELDGD